MVGDLLFVIFFCIVEEEEVMVKLVMKFISSFWDIFRINICNWFCDCRVLREEE